MIDDTQERISQWADRRAEELIFDRKALDHWRSLPLAERLRGIATYARLAGKVKIEDSARSMLDRITQGRG